MCAWQVNFADTAVGNVTSLLKAKGMYEDLVIVFSAVGAASTRAGHGARDAYAFRHMAHTRTRTH